MADRISITCNPSVWEVFLASLILLRYRWQLVLLHAVFPLTGLFLLLTPFLTGDRLGPIEISLAIAAFCFTPLVTALNIWSVRRRNQLAQGPFTHAFDSEGMHTSGEAFNQTIRWTAIPRIRRSRRFLFVFVAPARALCIPRRSINDEEFFEQLRNLAGERMDF